MFAVFPAFYNSPSLDSLGSAHSQASSQPTYQQYNGNGNGYHQQQYQQQAPVQNAYYGQAVQNPVYYGGQTDNSPYSQRIAQQAQGTVVYSSEMGGRGFCILLT